MFNWGACGERRTRPAEGKHVDGEGTRSLGVNSLLGNQATDFLDLPFGLGIVGWK